MMIEWCPKSQEKRLVVWSSSVKSSLSTWQKLARWSTALCALALACQPSVDKKKKWVQRERYPNNTCLPSILHYVASCPAPSRLLLFLRPVFSYHLHAKDNPNLAIIVLNLPSPPLVQSVTVQLQVHTNTSTFLLPNLHFKVILFRLLSEYKTAP